jgi:hypothetical protein
MIKRRVFVAGVAVSGHTASRASCDLLVVLNHRAEEIVQCHVSRLVLRLLHRGPHCAAARSAAPGPTPGGAPEISPGMHSAPSRVE